MRVGHISIARRYSYIYRQEQEEQLGDLGLTVNAIALWNSAYIEAAISQLTRDSWQIS